MNVNFIIYKYRFLFGYILIGLISILSELILNYLLEVLLNESIFISFLSVTIGVFIAFSLNINYNFKVSKSKRNRALKYFLIISFSSYFIQTFFLGKLDFFMNNSYYQTRIIVASFFFWISYFLHLNFSFKDQKRVGVAIYANGLEDIADLYKKIGDYPDFIHVDIVDKTFLENSEKVLSYKTEIIRAYWKEKIIEAHIMSTKPSFWIKKVANSVDRIYIHTNSSEKLSEVISLIRSLKCEAGLVITCKQDIKVLQNFNELIQHALILCIDKPGFSGQKFKSSSIELIKEIENLSFRQGLSLTVDGGVDNKNISMLSCENIVSGSYVLNSDEPIKRIMILQTSSNYEE